MSDAELIEKCVLIALIMIYVLVRYAREIKCEDCEDPYAIWTRAERQVCREGKNEYDYLSRGKERPKPQLWKPHPSRWEWIRRSVSSLLFVQ